MGRRLPVVVRSSSPTTGPSVLRVERIEGDPYLWSRSPMGIGTDSGGVNLSVVLVFGGKGRPSAVDFSAARTRACRVGSAACTRYVFLMEPSSVVCSLGLFFKPSGGRCVCTNPALCRRGATAPGATWP